MSREQNNEDHDVLTVGLPQQDSYHGLMRMLVWLSGLAIILLLILWTIAYLQQGSRYYATTAAGQVVAMHPLDEPVITSSYLLQWSSLATRTAFNLDWVNWSQRLDQVNADFTTEGWRHFKKALQQSGLLAGIRDKKLQMTAIVSNTPIILHTAVISGRFTWRVQLPVLITFVSASETVQSSWLVTMNIQRISTLDAYKGIQITDFVVSPALSR